MSYSTPRSSPGRADIHMVPPQSEITAISTLKLTATKPGWKAFEILFPALLPQHLLDFFESAKSLDYPQAKTKGAIAAHNAQADLPGCEVP